MLSSLYSHSCSVFCLIPAIVNNLLDYFCIQIIIKLDFLGKRSNFEQCKPKLIEMQQLCYSAYRISKETELCCGTVRKYLSQLDRDS